MTQPKADPQGLLSDQPILSKDQDRLGRVQFASLLAKQLVKDPDPSCLVLALYSPWGSGKSSLLNLIQAEIAEASDAPEHKPLVLRFDPWNFTSLDQLIAMFFRELEVALGRSVKDTEKLKKGLRALSIVLASGELSPIGGALFGLASKTMKAAASELEKRRESLSSTKEAINKELRSLGQRVFVMVDDIDRLDKESMNLMFRLVRLNADFDGMTYILAFDREVVEKVLTVERVVSGRDFLDKIVQVGFDIPPAEPQKLKRVFEEAFSSLGLAVDETEGEEARWLDLRHGALEHIIRTPRDILRYVNGLSVNVAIVGQDVNPIDFAGLEAIRTFAPDLYAFIRDNRDILIGRAGGSVDMIEADRKRLGVALENCDPDLRDGLREACEQLFPEVQTLNGGATFSGSFHEGWRQSRRICTIEHFHRYFYLRPFEHEISEAEYRATVGDGSSRQKMVKHYEGLIESQRIVSFLGRLADGAKEFPIDGVAPTVTALFDVGDSLDMGSYEVGQLVEASWAAEKLIATLPSQSRLKVARKIVREAQSLGALVFFLGFIEQSTPKERAWLMDREFQQVRGDALKRIRASAKDGTLPGGRHFGSTLFKWRDWTDRGRPARRYVKKLIESDDGLIGFLVGMLAARSSSAGKYAVRHGSYISLDGVKALVEPEGLLSRVRGIKDNEWGRLTDEQRLAVDAVENPHPL